MTTPRQRDQTLTPWVQEATHLETDAELCAALWRVREQTAAQPHGDEQAPEPVRIDEALSRVVWSRLAEPGDAIAGALVRALGAAPALDAVVSGLTGDAVHAQLRRLARESEHSARMIQQGLARWRPRIDREASLGDLHRASASGTTVLFPGDAHWPAGLSDLGDHAPLLLWVRGDTARLGERALAVVGARACTAYGSTVTGDLTAAACETGAVIISGGAYGIDAVAHRAALATSGHTVAVLAGGADRPYPAAHHRLFERITEQGAICSEMVPGAAPTRWRFLQRNRIIAALAAGTLVTEAGVRSGSLNTAGHAASLGRDLGAVPGPITSVASAGCHRLIRDYGATLISSEAELREFLGCGDEPEAKLPEHEAGTNSGPAATASNDLSGRGVESGDPAPRAEQQRPGWPRTERQPALHRRLLDALPLSNRRSEEEAVRHAGVSPADARRGYAELEALGHVGREETPDGARAWRLLRRE